MPWKKDETPAPNAVEKPDVNAEAADAAAEQRTGKAYTPKKGRPTPKRNEVERKVGSRRTAYDAPTSSAEARKRRKELKNSMSKEEYKAMKQREREESARERRRINERMMAGDEEYLMARDKGPEKRFVRNWVDSRRFLMNFFLPLTFIVIIIMLLGMRNAAIANLASIVMLVLFAIMLAEGLIMGRRVNREVNARFRNNPHSKFSLGMYAFTRATMIRRMRTPAPQVNIGDTV
ncbi:DUF3043 domain-containing protein [Corynebacterium anserum]|uniref:DUF3043 domain-containing protein n=1 Tax=Corynebacterium anserum TaxID=2684406 RepID=A0A7G7YQX6_9CORY|nr:DUF3043 domain-containing protein [Corynebacterium anserum]MBC2680949.1 DUF3043 domain-containing protein [Corynebacterium anserum]QNH96896.1 DUF3043 domain-containing protein [Corynebacterium anserum]